MSPAVRALLICAVCFPPSTLHAKDTPDIVPVSIEAACETAYSTPLAKRYAEASAKVSAIQSALENSIPSAERAYFEPIVQAVSSALTKHHPNFAAQKSFKGLDLPRHMAILNAIADFDPSVAKFSLYKIKRAIEGRYSLAEYIDCRP